LRSFGQTHVLMDERRRAEVNRQNSVIVACAGWLPSTSLQSIECNGIIQFESAVCRTRKCSVAKKLRCEMTQGVCGKKGVYSSYSFRLINMRVSWILVVWSAVCAAADKPKQKSPWGPLFEPPALLETIDFRFELLALPPPRLSALRRRPYHVGCDNCPSVLSGFHIMPIYHR
jgi:hypothetical protein